MSDVLKIMAPIYRKVSNMITRGVVSSVGSLTKMQTLQLRLLAGESKDEVEYFEPFGFTSVPLPGAEHVSVFLDGDRSHGITLVVSDRRYRLTTLAAGEAALHDAYGNKVHLKADGTLDVVATTKVQITSPLVTISGNLQVTGSITGTGGLAVSGGSGVSMNGNITHTGTITSNSVNIGSTHTHSGVQTGGGNTGAPN